MLGKVKFFIQQSWLLIVASFFFGLLLAATNYAWKDRIAQNQQDRFSELAGQLLPKAEKFGAGREVSIPGEGEKVIRVTLKKAVGSDGRQVGWAFEAEGSGFADKIKLVVAVDAGFEKIAGYGVLMSNETPGYGDQIKEDYFKDQFEGAPADELELAKTGDPAVIDDTIVAITGATVTSESVVKIFNRYLEPLKEKIGKGD